MIRAVCGGTHLTVGVVVPAVAGSNGRQGGSWQPEPDVGKQSGTCQAG